MAALKSDKSCFTLNLRTMSHSETNDVRFTRLFCIIVERWSHCISVSREKVIAEMKDGYVRWLTAVANMT